MNDLSQLRFPNDQDEYAVYRPGSFGGLLRYNPEVMMAQRYLQSAMSAKPQPYQSRYSDQIENLYQRIMNRPAFSYNAHQDPLFQQYRNQYLREGQRAMQDSIGASAALTGGYGNSWAGTAGYQAYGEYLKALNDKLPELEKRAQERYTAEGDALNNKANLLLNLDNREYGWYRDAMKDWQFDAKLALQQKDFDVQALNYLQAMLSYQDPFRYHEQDMQEQAASAAARNAEQAEHRPPQAFPSPAGNERQREAIENAALEEPARRTPLNKKRMGR